MALAYGSHRQMRLHNTVIQARTGLGAPSPLARKVRASGPMRTLCCAPSVASSPINAGMLQLGLPRARPQTIPPTTTAWPASTEQPFSAAALAQAQLRSLAHLSRGLPQVLPTLRLPVWPSLDSTSSSDADQFPLVPCLLAATTHGSATARGARKPEMQDRHVHHQDVAATAQQHLVPAHAPVSPQHNSSTAWAQQPVQDSWQLDGNTAWLATAGGALAAGSAGVVSFAPSVSVVGHSRWSPLNFLFPSPSASAPQAVASCSHNATASGSAARAWPGVRPGWLQAGATGQASKQAALRQLLASLSTLPTSLTAVFDGHAGCRAATTAAARLPQLVAQSKELWTAMGELLQGGQDPSAASQALAQCLTALDQEILTAAAASPAIKVDGCTALAGLQVGEHLLVANCGDSRAVLCRGGQAVRLTRDHTPELEDERARIEAVGGVVAQVRGVWRVVLPMGPGKGAKLCAVSRALGDGDYKAPLPLVSGEAEVVHWPLLPDLDQFVVYASDGIWCVLSDQDAVDQVRFTLNQLAWLKQQEAAARGGAEDEWGAGSSTARGQLDLSPPAVARACAAALLRLAQERGSADDLSVVVQLLEWQQDSQ